MKKIYVFFTVLAISLPATAYGAEFLRPSSNDGAVVVSSQETHKNLYVGGASVTLDGKIEGDLVAGGAMVNVDGNIEDDLLLAGANVNVHGGIGGNARVAGGNVTFSSPVNGDLLVAGGNVTLTPNASVGGDLWVCGGSVVINSPVRGKVWVVGGNVVINSQIDGDVVVKSKDSLRFGESADINGKITYHGRKSAIIDEGARVPEINFVAWGGKSGATSLKGMVGSLVVQLVAWIIAGLLLIYLFKKHASQVINKGRKELWKSLGGGILFLVITPVIMIAGLLIGVGYYISLALLMSYVLVWLISFVVGMVWLGAWVLNKLVKREELVLDWQAVILGAALMVVLCLIPVVGWLASFVIAVAFGGSLVRCVWDNIKN